MMESAMTKVLCVESPGLLGETRRLLLEYAGHSVLTASSLREVEAACRSKQVRVAVVGESIPQKKLLARRLRECCPAVRILELHSTTGERAITDADDWLDVPSLHPGELAQRVEALTQRHRKKPKSVGYQDSSGVKGHSRRFQERMK